MNAAEKSALVLTMAHREGVVHRDVGARNFLMDINGDVFLCDFGLAWILPPDIYSDVGQLNEPMPLKWSSPESIRQRYIGPQADVWMFGVFLYEMFTGLQPFEQITLGDFAALKYPENDPSILADKQKHQIPSDVLDIMKSCWKRNYNLRPTMGEIHRQLRSINSKLDSSAQMLTTANFANLDTSPVSTAKYFRMPDSEGSKTTPV